MMKYKNSPLEEKKKGKKKGEEEKALEFITEILGV